MGNIYYTAIRVNSLNEAINLCIKYNKLSNLKVHLHYLTYENSKKELPKVLLEKNFIKEKLSLYEDEYMKNHGICDFIWRIRLLIPQGHPWAGYFAGSSPGGVFRGVNPYSLPTDAAAKRNLLYPLRDGITGYPLSRSRSRPYCRHFRSQHPRNAPAPRDTPRRSLSHSQKTVLWESPAPF